MDFAGMMAGYSQFSARRINRQAAHDGAVVLPLVLVAL